MRSFTSATRVPILALLLTGVLCQSTFAAAPKKLLIVLSSEGQEKGKLRPGYEMDELSQAYLIFRQNDFVIDIASPKGGTIEADGFDAKTDFNAEFLRDAHAVKTLQNTKKTAALDAADYAAVYIAGGKGAMFDLPRDAALAQIVREIYEAGGIVAAVCHGPAALVNVRLSDGKGLLANRKATGFSNEEEAVFGKKWQSQYPFLLEDAMRKQGARWVEAPLMLSHVISDGRLITGQNPYSTAGVAEALVRASGGALAKRTPWRDELTMQLMQDALAAESSEAAAKQLRLNPDQYHMELIGLVGYYQLQSTEQPAAVRSALKLMQLAAPFMDAPELKLGMASAHQKLGQMTQARELVDALLITHPDLAAAKDLSKALAEAKE